MPGIAVGAQDPLTIAPALPKEAPEQGAHRSINVTSCPSFCSANAVAAPMTPAPIMIVLLGIVSDLPIKQYPLCLQLSGREGSGTLDFETTKWRDSQSLHAQCL